MELLKQIGTWLSSNAFSVAIGLLVAWMLYSRFSYLFKEPEKEDPNSPLVTLNADNWQQEVLRAKQPVLVDFWAPWCGPCRAQGPVVSRLALKLSATAKVGKVNVDQNQGLAQQYGISGIPALLIFKDGKVVKSFMGMTSETVLENALK